MLNKLFNLVPPKVVRYIGNKSFASLQERGEIKTWMVGYTQNSSLLHSREGGEDEDNDGDDGDFDSLFDFDFDEDAVPQTCGVEADYIARQISRIPHYGDDARWRLASHLDMFSGLDPTGKLTDEQRQAVDNFVLAWEKV